MKMPKPVALTAGGRMLFLLPIAENDAPSEPRASVELTLPSTLLTFSLGEILNHFDEAFGKRPFRLDERTIVCTDRKNPHRFRRDARKLTEKKSQEPESLNACDKVLSTRPSS